MKKKINIYLLIGSFFLVLSILFIGVFRDDEFYEPSLFMKYKPAFKLEFYSTTGMSDLTVSDLSPEKQKEEIAFQDFVIDHGIQYPGDKFWFIPLLLIQLTLTFLAYGLAKIQAKFLYLLFHFIANLIFTVFGIAFMMHYDKLIASLLLTILILLINLISLKAISPRKKDLKVNAIHS